MTDLLRRPAFVRAASVLASMLLVSAFVVRTSQAAFTAEHVNDANEFVTADLTLDDGVTKPLFGDPATALVDATALYPGKTISGCLDVTYAGDLTGAEITSVKLASTGATGTLADVLDVSVAMTPDCTTAPAAGAPSTTHTLSTWASQTFDSTWTPATVNEARGFHFTVTLQSGADDEVKNTSVNGVGFTWSIQSA